VTGACRGHISDSGEALVKVRATASYTWRVHRTRRFLGDAPRVARSHRRSRQLDRRVRRAPVLHERPDWGRDRGVALGLPEDFSGLPLPPTGAVDIGAYEHTT
jgi:hypothetical protein